MNLLQPRLEEKRKKWRQEKLAHTAIINEQRCSSAPVYGWDLVRALRLVDLPDVSPCNLAHNSHTSLYWYQTEALSKAVLSVEDRLQELKHLIDRYLICLLVNLINCEITHFFHTVVRNLLEYVIRDF